MSSASPHDIFAHDACTSGLPTNGDNGFGFFWRACVVRFQSGVVVMDSSVYDLASARNRRCVGRM